MLLAAQVKCFWFPIFETDWKSKQWQREKQKSFSFPRPQSPGTLCYSNLFKIDVLPKPYKTKGPFWVNSESFSVFPSVSVVLQLFTLHQIVSLTVQLRQQICKSLL